MTTSQPHEGANRPDPTQPAPAAADTYVGPETWVREAIAEQEEYIRRWRSCMDTLGRSHSYRDVTLEPTPSASEGGEPLTPLTFRACTVCGVTQTREDYQTRQQASHGHPETL